MANIKIERDIPLPGMPRNPRGIYVDTLRQLQVGDSFTLELKLQKNVGCSAKRLGIKIVTRKISPTHTRIWRTK
jgi:hypothetical protein